uniref:Uncharacterized protein n=1 Tax=Arundo donax TaxID=35708 RepID=A0A0A9A0L7_ARUDO
MRGARHVLQDRTPRAGTPPVRGNAEQEHRGVERGDDERCS